MKEKEAYEILGWVHAGKGNDGDEWLAFSCSTPACQSEGVARSGEFGFGRCGRCSAIMEVVNGAGPQACVKDGDHRNPRTSTPAKSAGKVNVSRELTNATNLGEQLEGLLVNRGQCPDDDRNILLLAYWALIFDFHKAILDLIAKQLCGSAFALVRPCLEALVRAHVAVKGSAQDVKNLQEDAYYTDFDSIGQWMDKEFATEKLFTTFIGGAQAALHSFTHAGLAQIGRRFEGHDLRPSYHDGEVVEVIRVCTSAVWMVTNLVTIHLGFTKEVNQAETLYIEWGKH
jgi:uncharacterized protein DUF6988